MRLKAKISEYIKNWHFVNIFMRPAGDTTPGKGAHSHCAIEKLSFLLTLIAFCAILNE